MAFREIPNDREYTHEELLEMKHSQAIKGLSEKAQKFCEYFVEGYNKKTALINAGFECIDSQYSYRLLRDPRVQRYIHWLKARALKAVFVNAEDLLDHWIRIAFADMTDFVDIKKTYITLKPANLVDGQLIKSIKSGKDGVSIELHDKMKALDNLAKYMEGMPKEWKQKVEERKLELQAEELAIKKQMYELNNPAPEEDGFLAAIKESAKVVWEQTKGTEEP